LADQARARPDLVADKAIEPAQSVDFVLALTG
jgi:hypothetical protein